MKQQVSRRVKSLWAACIEEVQRASDFSNDLSLVMVSIDRMDDHIVRYGREAFDFILQNVGRIGKGFHSSLRCRG